MVTSYKLHKAVIAQESPGFVFYIWIQIEYFMLIYVFVSLSSVMWWSNVVVAWMIVHRNLGSFIVDMKTDQELLN